MERVVNLVHPRIKFLSSGIWILFRGSHSKIRLRMKSSSADNGKIDLRKLGLLRYALNVESSIEALFQGFLPHVRFTRIIPRDQTSLGPDA